MTCKELTRMTGSEEQAEYAMKILLKNCKESFIRMTIKAEIAEIDEQVKAFKADGIIVNWNGSDRVNWCAPDAVFGNEPGAAWNATEEQEAQAEAIKARCFEAADLLYRRNRTISLLAVR